MPTDAVDDEEECEFTFEDPEDEDRDDVDDEDSEEDEEVSPY